MPRCFCGAQLLCSERRGAAVIAHVFRPPPKPAECPGGIIGLLVAGVEWQIVTAWRDLRMNAKLLVPHPRKRGIGPGHRRESLLDPAHDGARAAPSPGDDAAAIASDAIYPELMEAVAELRVEGAVTLPVACQLIANGSATLPGRQENRDNSGGEVVGATGIEPVTPTMSR